MSADLYKLYEEVASANGLSILLRDYGVQPISIFGARVLSSSEKEEALISILKDMQPGRFLLITHPALDNEEQRAISHKGYDTVAKDRSSDLHMLTSDLVRSALSNYGITVIDYENLKKLGTKK